MLLENVHEGIPQGGAAVGRYDFSDGKYRIFFEGVKESRNYKE
jgi:hypothetical protein